MEAIHIKTGNKYFVINDGIINATNANDGQLMVLYSGKRRGSDSMGVFVRERSEFLEKFKIIKK